MERITGGAPNTCSLLPAPHRTDNTPQCEFTANPRKRHIGVLSQALITRTCTHPHACMHASTHTHTHTPMHIHTDMYAHKHTCRLWQPALERDSSPQTEHNFRGEKPKMHVYSQGDIKYLTEKPQKNRKPVGITSPIPCGWTPHHPRGPVSHVVSPMGGKALNQPSSPTLHLALRYSVLS